jgi:hypothetical protein
MSDALQNFTPKVAVGKFTAGYIVTPGVRNCWCILNKNTGELVYASQNNMSAAHRDATRMYDIERVQ